MAGKGTQFFGGIPTDIDIRALRDAYPPSSLTVGRKITYAEIGGVIKTSPDSDRWRTVTGRWRRFLDAENGILLHAADGTHFTVSNDHEKLDLAGSKLLSAGRAVKRSFRVLGLTDRKALTEPERERHDHIAARAGAILAIKQVKRPVDLPQLGEK